jgi:hypothetical protein
VQVRRLESSRAAADATAEAASQALREAHQQRSAAAAAAEEAGSDSATAAVAAAMLRQQLTRAQEERAELSRQVDQLQVRLELVWMLGVGLGRTQCTAAVLTHQHVTDVICRLRCGHCYSMPLMFMLLCIPLPTAAG